MAAQGEAVRVVVVDDSVVVRRLVTDALSADPGIEVVGTGRNGRLGVEAVLEHRPDVVVMDIEMPEMTGIEAVRTLRARGERVPVIMFSTLTEAGARATFDALEAGATDYVAKPGQAGAVGRSLDTVRQELIPRVHSLGRRRGARSAPGALPPGFRPVRVPARPTLVARDGEVAPTRRSARQLAARAPSLVAIGSSTGGPEALATVLGGLPGDLPVPVVVVQHMPAEFTPLLAERLARASRLDVRHAEERMPLEPGRVVIARGGQHLEVVTDQGKLRVHLSDAPPEHFCRPAVDVLFRSVARAVGGRTLAVVLTGMGSDGTPGARELKSVGATVWAQDEPTSVVWGMPGSIAREGLADEVLPLPGVAGGIATAVQRATSTAPAGSDGPARPAATATRTSDRTSGQAPDRSPSQTPDRSPSRWPPTPRTAPPPRSPRTAGTRPEGGS